MIEKFKSNLRNVISATLSHRGIIPACDGCIDLICKEVVIQLKGRRGKIQIVDALSTQVQRHEDLCNITES